MRYHPKYAWCQNDPEIINSNDFPGFYYIIDPTKWAHWSHHDVKNGGSFIKIGQFFAKQLQFRRHPVCETCDSIDDIFTRSSIFLKFVYTRCFTTEMKYFVSWLVYTCTIQLVHSWRNPKLFSMLLPTGCNFGVKKDPTLQLTQVFLLCYSKVKNPRQKLAKHLQIRPVVQNSLLVNIGDKIYKKLGRNPLVQLKKLFSATSTCALSINHRLSVTNLSTSLTPSASQRAPVKVTSHVNQVPAVRALCTRRLRIGLLSVSASFGECRLCWHNMSRTGSKCPTKPVFIRHFIFFPSAVDLYDSENYLKPLPSFGTKFI